MTDAAAPRDGFSVVRLLGETDAYSAPRVRDDVTAALGGGSPLVIDLTRATFVDSTIVGVMLESLKQAEQLDRKLLLLLPEDGSPEIHRLFELTGLGRLLPVVGSWEEAAQRLLQ